MRRRLPRSIIFAATVVASLGIVIILTGCGGGMGSQTPTLHGIQGMVHGGQQPVSGSTIQLYAAGTGGYGSPADARILSTVTTDAGGRFSITGDYMCPTLSTETYIVSTGGDPGAGNNDSLALMAALGPCGNLSDSTFILIDEVTTVASVYALAPFMGPGGGTHLGTSSTNMQGMVNAFSTVNNLVNTASGRAPGPSLPAGATAPSIELNTLADILAPCVNSNGISGACSALFMAATPPNGGIEPTNTIDAVLDIALNPANNVGTLYSILNGAAPFLPILGTAPNDWTIAINYTGGGLSAPADIAVDSVGNIWTANSGNSTISEFSSAGAALSSSNGYTGGGQNQDRFIAIDNSGNVWVTNPGNVSISEFTSAGASLSPDITGFTGGGMSPSFGPFGIAADALGNVWIANPGNSSLSEFSSAGAPLSPALTGYTGGGLNSPVFVALDGSGNLWIANYQGSSMSKFDTMGNPLSPAPNGYTGGGLNQPSCIAIDSSGNLWITNFGNNSLSKFDSTGAAVSSTMGYVGGGINNPYHLTVDGSGHVWVSNAGNNSISEFSSSGTAISPSTGYTGGGMNAPYSLAIDGSGGIWVANHGGASVTQFVGAASPVITPLSTAAINDKLGIVP